MTGTVELRPPTGWSGRGSDVDRGLFARLGRTVTAHPFKVAIGWLVIVAALIGISSVLGQPTPSQATASELPASYESARAQAVIDKAFGAPSSDATAFLVISRTDGQRLSASDRVVLGFCATLGASVLLFQRVLGHSGIDFQLPLIVYLFVASIGTDYNILIASRLREEMWNGASRREAAVTAVRSAGPAVAAAGLVLATSFALLMISPLIADIGFAVAAGVLLSAFINAFLLIPSLTTMAGKAAWWPSRPRRPAHAGLLLHRLDGQRAVAP